VCVLCSGEGVCGVYVGGYLRCVWVGDFCVGCVVGGFFVYSSVWGVGCRCYVGCVGFVLCGGFWGLCGVLWGFVLWRGLGVVGGGILGGVWVCLGWFGGVWWCIILRERAPPPSACT